MTATVAPEVDLDAAFAALADPTRRGIVVRLSNGDATVTELARPFAMTVQAVSQHIAVLERAGLVSRSRAGQTRPCRLETAALESAVGWIEASTRAWSERFDKLDAHLRTLGER
jgi:DNA-binding transcriptional ArsR family regulator